MSQPRDPLPDKKHEDESRTERILRARAAALARVHERRMDDEGKSREVLEFMLGHEKYAIETRYAQSVFLPRVILPIPGTPPFVRGVVSRLGRVLAVVDLGRFLPDAVPIVEWAEGPQRLLVLQHGEMELALAVDEVGVVRRVGQKHLEGNNGVATKALAPYILGVTGEPMIVLDGAKLLGEPSLIVGN